ncbi:MAG TPA: alpha/beta fold hydrolase, partial [Geminicoccus sp.]|uniref:alpha/beta hydrolase family protein n=1 Tax=Geminicoccus sp. TaxID=2024832 RepID=UPI002C6F62A8
MSPFARLAALLALLLGIASATPTARAQEGEPVRLASGISYQLITRWDVDRLNQILEVDTQAFAGIATRYTPAINAVRLFRVSYPSVIPEHGNRPTVATGLLAVPEVEGTALPMVSYQHGTVYGKEEVPSFPEQSPETQLMIAQFAGQGYLLIGADYFGMGQSEEPEGYMVKGSHQQATFDMLMASRAVLADLKLDNDKLFLAGWSQGGFVTMAFLEKLEQADVPVQAAATASAPVDVFVALNGFLNFPRKNDASWVTTLFILSSFSFEHYYGVPGLARSLINDEHYEISRKAYERQPFDPADVPTDLHRLIR